MALRPRSWVPFECLANCFGHEERLNASRGVNSFLLNGGNRGVAIEASTSVAMMGRTHRPALARAACVAVEPDGDYPGPG